jgi:hypothetical protein
VDEVSVFLTHSMKESNQLTAIKQYGVVFSRNFGVMSQQRYVQQTSKRLYIYTHEMAQYHYFQEQPG